MKNKKILFERLIGILFALFVWQAAAMIINSKIILASPLSVIIRLGTLCLEDDFWLSILFSFIRIFFGFLIGLVSGIILSMLASKFRTLEILLRPFITAMKTVPVASFIVISLIWFGSDKLSIFISFLMVFPIIYTNLLDGIKATDPKMLEMASLFRVNEIKRILYIYMPATAEAMISGCRVSLGFAWKAGIAAEVIGIPMGSIGEKLYEAKLYFDTDDLLAWTLVIIIMSVLFEKLFIYILKRLFTSLRTL